MRTIRSLLFLIAIAVLIAACGSAGVVRRSSRTAGRRGRRQRRRQGLSGGADGAPPAEPGNRQSGVGGGQIAAVDDAKIIRTGTMSLEVSDVGAALRTARDAIVGLGGYVGASTTSNDGEQPSAQITYRIPADHGRRRSISCAASTA